ncbi:unnamed protein product [Cunninghamella blakesleeana]
MLFKSVIGLLLSTVAVYGLTPGVDNSALVSQATYAKALGQGFTKLVIRGYQEACSSGGRVDPNFVTNYKNAVAAGYKDIDTYWFPCTGSGNSCKSFSAQLKELGTTFNNNKLNIGRIWVDIETDPTCGAWNYGTAGNLKQAKALIAAIKASGYNFGIYSSPGVWSTIFGSYGVVVDNTVPLWFATYDGVQSLTLKQPFGGWTKAVGKQYTDKSASGLFDLNVFA